MDINDGLFNSGESIQLCKGDFLLLKPICPEGGLASIVLIRMIVRYAQYVKVSLVGASGNVIDTAIVSV